MCMNEFQSEIKTFDDSDIYFSDERGNKTIGFVTPDELLDNAASLEPLYVGFDV